MNLVLQPSIITLDYVRAIGRGTLRLGTDKADLASLFQATHVSKLTAREFRELRVAPAAKGKMRVIVDDVGELPLPIIEANRAHDLPDDSFMLTNGPFARQFGLAMLGLQGELHINDVSDAELRAMAAAEFSRAAFTGRNLNAIDVGVTGHEVVDTSDTPETNDAVNYVSDARYQIAAHTLFQAGHKIPLFDRQEGARVLHSVEDQRDLEAPFAPDFRADFDTRRFLPLVHPDILDRAETYYAADVPQAYAALGHGIPLSQLVAQLLPRGEAFTAHALVGFSGLEAGQAVSLVAENDPDKGGTVLLGEDQRIEDCNLTSPVDTPLLVTDDAAIAHLARYGYRPENLLDWFTGLRELAEITA